MAPSPARFDHFRPRPIHSFKQQHQRSSDQHLLRNNHDRNNHDRSPLHHAFSLRSGQVTHSGYESSITSLAVSSPRLSSELPRPHATPRFATFPPKKASQLDDFHHSAQSHTSSSTITSHSSDTRRAPKMAVELALDSSVSSIYGCGPLYQLLAVMLIASLFD